MPEKHSRCTSAGRAVWCTERLWRLDAVEAIRQERATSRGAFTTRTFLIETHEPDVQ